MLPTVKDLKDYLRIETAAEDSTITDLLSQALSWAEGIIGRPILAVERTFYGSQSYTSDYGPMYLSLPEYPVADVPAPVITDSTGAVVDAADYRLDGVIGQLVANDGFWFGDFPYKIVATVGLSAHPQYATKYEPNVRALIMGLASILYHRRNPGTSSESSGGGTSIMYGGEGSTFGTGVPTHLQSIVNALKAPSVG